MSEWGQKLFSMQVDHTRASQEQSFEKQRRSGVNPATELKAVVAAHPYNDMIRFPRRSSLALVAYVEALERAVEFAHANGFEWPSDPFAVPSQDDPPP